MSVFPAHAGVIPGVLGIIADGYSFPRTRGGDPNSYVPMLLYLLFSPHTRGGSLEKRPLQPTRFVFPAHAGVILVVDASDAG